MLLFKSMHYNILQIEINMNNNIKEKIEIIKTIQSNKEDCLEQLIKYQSNGINIKDIDFLFSALVYGKQPGVFAHIYHEMNKEKSVQFDDDFFSHSFSIAARKEQDTFIPKTIFTVYEGLTNMIFSNRTDNFEGYVDKIFVENKLTIQKNLFSTDMAFLKKPLNELPKKLEKCTLELLINIHQGLEDKALDIISSNEYNRFSSLKKAMSYFEHKEIYENFLVSINRQVFSSVINMNKDLIDDPIWFRNHIENAICSHSIEAFKMLVNKNIDIYKPDSKAGTTIFDLLLKNSYHHINDSFPMLSDPNNVTKQANKSILESDLLKFYDKAIGITTEMFDSYKNSYIFKEEKQSSFENYLKFANYFNLQQTQACLEKIKIFNNIQHSPAVENTPDSKRRL